MKNLLLALVLFSTLVGTVHAQSEFGELLFRDFLGITEYPGSPFSGEPIRDLVMYFFVPSALCVIIIYSIVGRFYDNTKIQLLLGITLYTFIIFGGYFKIFILLAGPYFLFLLIFVGFFMFILSHFGVTKREHGGQGSGMSGTAVGVAENPSTHRGGFRGVHALEEELEDVDKALRKINNDIIHQESREEKSIEKGGNTAPAETALSTLITRRNGLEDTRTGLVKSINDTKRDMGIKY